MNQKGLFPLNPVLIVDDEKEILRSFSIALRSESVNNILTCQDSRDVEGLLSRQEPELILLDLTMPYISGEELLSRITGEYPHIPVIIVTGNTEIETAVKCMKAKAFDYMVKPVEKSRLVSGVKRAIELRELRSQVQVLRQSLIDKDIERSDAFSDIITRNHIMLSLFRYAECIAPSPEPVLITGETGVGKELMARAIHRLSGRIGEFIGVNVAGLDDNIFSDTLFGHVKGAYTGAEGTRKGMVDRAAGGTLLLDEVGDLNPHSQIKLLRLLQEGEYYPLGSDLAKTCNARIIVTTNRDLKGLRDSGVFRKDLYYRLCTHHIHIPPLRERLDDLPLLLDHFLEQAAEDLGKAKPAYPDELLLLLNNYSFPGNIRELRTMVYDAVGAHRSKILSMKRFKMRMEGSGKSGAAVYSHHAMSPGLSFLSGKHLPTIEEATRLLISEAMKRTRGNQSMAAQMLGISRQRLARNLKTMQSSNVRPSSE